MLYLCFNIKYLTEKIILEYNSDLFKYLFNYLSFDIKNEFFQQNLFRRNKISTKKTYDHQ